VSVTLFTEIGDLLMIPLSEFREGERGVIARVNGSGAFRKRLQEMGFIRGVDVLVEKYAPLRDPIELVLKGYHVSLRVEEAAQLMMEKPEQEIG
jgi:Fe2+ transport system protein FeoA